MAIPTSAAGRGKGKQVVGVGSPVRTVSPRRAKVADDEAISSPLLLSSSDDDDDNHGMGAPSRRADGMLDAEGATAASMDVMKIALRHKQQFGLLDDDDDDDDGMVDVDAGGASSSPLRSRSAASPRPRSAVRGAAVVHRDAVALNADNAGSPEGLMSVVHALRRERSITSRKHQEEVSRLQRTIATMERRALKEVKELAERQSAIEKGNMLGSMGAAEQTREALRNLEISGARYAELKTMKPSQRSYVDTVRMRVHEEVFKAKEELETLRIESANASDEAVKWRGEANRARREHEAAAGEVTELRADRERETKAAASREAKLRDELAVATREVKSLGEKASRSDELRSALNDAEARFREASGALTKSRQESEKLRRRVDELEGSRAASSHTEELLKMDKVYLQKEVEGLTDRCVRAETESDGLRSKIFDLKKQRQDLYDRIVNEQTDSKASQEARMQGEISRLQAAAREDIERIRVENLAAHEREVSALKEMRDTGAMEAKRLQSELRESRRSFEELLLRHRESQKDADVRQAELLADLKMKSFELERMRVLSEESTSTLRQSDHEREMLREKVRVLSESYQRLDADLAKQMHELEAKCSTQESQLRHYEMLEREIDEAVLATGNVVVAPGTAAGGCVDGKEGANEVGGARQSILEGIGASLPVSVRRRVQQSIALSRRCKELEDSLARVEAERSKLMKESSSHKVEAERLRRRMESVEQPYAMIARSMKDMEDRLEASSQRCEELQAQLAEADEQKQRMREDMEELVNDRNAMVMLHEEMNAEFAAAAATAAAEAVAAASNIANTRDALSGRAQRGGRMSAPGGHTASTTSMSMAFRPSSTTRGGASSKRTVPQAPGAPPMRGSVGAIQVQ